jgi:hypothetical protein
METYLIAALPRCVLCASGVNKALNKNPDKAFLIGVDNQTRSKTTIFLC